MKRRSFLGFLGAAASGPTLAKGIASEASSFGVPPSGGYNLIPSTISNSDWRPARILELRRLISGDDDGGESARQRRISRLSQLEQVERYRLDSLRSISPQHKMAMFIDGNLDRQERVRIGWLENELEQLLAVKIV